MSSSSGWKTHAKAYLELIRYPLTGIPIVATLPGVVIASDGWSWRVPVAMLVALFGYWAGMMKNDYFHQEKDRLTHPERPLPSHRLDTREVFWAASSLYILCVLLGFALHPWAGLLVIVLVMISHLYNAILKEQGIWGSISLPLGIALLNVFGALAVSGTVPGLVWIAFGATFLYDFGTHIVTTFKDMERERQLGTLTTPVQIGIRPALLLSSMATFLAFGIVSLPYLLGWAKGTYLIWMGIALVATAVTRIPLLRHPSEQHGYLALKGSMIGAIIFFPCMVGVVWSQWKVAILVLPLLLITLGLLEMTRQEV